MDADWDEIKRLLKEGEVQPVQAKTAELDCYMCDGKGCEDCLWTGRIDIHIGPCMRIVETWMRQKANLARSSAG